MCAALWRRLFSLPRRLSSRCMDREPLQQHVSARVPRRQPKRLRHDQLAQFWLKADEKSGLGVPLGSIVAPPTQVGQTRVGGIEFGQPSRVRPEPPAADRKWSFPRLWHGDASWSPRVGAARCAAQIRMLGHFLENRSLFACLSGEGVSARTAHLTPVGVIPGTSRGAFRPFRGLYWGLYW